MYERSGVSFQGGDMGSQNNHPDYFFFQKAAHRSGRTSGDLY
jgi:hypothetical protein